jgi:hypothetical protein
MSVFGDSQGAKVFSGTGAEVRKKQLEARVRENGDRS